MIAEQTIRRSYAVWEITLACNLACVHCGSRAGKAREKELTTAEALDLVRQLAEAGIDEITLIGGEAFLRRDWLEIVTAIRRSGMDCGMTTGGFGIGPRLAEKMAKAGLQQVSVSVDGTEETHDKLRGREGSWRAALTAMRAVHEVGIVVTCNTQINRLNAAELPQAYELQKQAGMKVWQLQLTVPMGNAADRAEILLQPCELLELFPMLARLKERADSDGVDIYPGNNLGYFGPYDETLRGLNGERRVWTSCHAGLNTLGIEADGTIKGCPSLPTATYRGGNIRRNTLAEIVTTAPELNFNAAGDTAHLWGFCQSCEYAPLCRGGCSWTAHVFFGRRGNNPYCHHRAVSLAAQGLRERLRPVQPAQGQPFDHGVFELILEPSDAPWPRTWRARLSEVL